jgi:hypothetical protein
VIIFQHSKVNTMSLNYLSSAERRARAILDAYGSWPVCWPAAERQATRDCIAHSTALQHYQAQIAYLDKCIQSEQATALQPPADVLALQQRILASLPAQPSTQANSSTASVGKRIIDWLLPPRFALALAGIAVLAIVMLVPRTQPHVNFKQAASPYEAWTWYDVTGQELPVATSTAALTMTDLIDLEVNEDGG